MAKKLVLVLVLAILFVPGWARAQPRAGECVIGPGLASTLLIPYFEVDLANPTTGVTTLMSVNNGLSSATMVRVILWTDWGIPTVAFDVYLQGFDVQTISLRDVFNGIIPSTGEGVSLSGWDDCELPDYTPIHANPALTNTEIAKLRAHHLGTADPVNGLCHGEYYDDDVARGYVTVDVVDECYGVDLDQISGTPAHWRFFEDGGVGSGVAIIDNRLWGDVFYVDPANAAAQGTEAIAIWADATLFSGSDIYTFYGRYSGWSGDDDRVPLPRRWDQRFLNGGPFTGGTDFIVWRDTESAMVSGISCLSVPGWWPLHERTISEIDEDANWTTIGNDTTIFYLATQKVSTVGIGLINTFGWFQIDTYQDQMWVQPVLSALGQYSLGLNGMPVEFLCGLTPP